MAKRTAWLIILLLAAASLRLLAIDQIPPGLTHDEADHGLDAWGVVNGVRPIYFSVGYGREPLYDYATSGLMSFLGPSFLAGRLTSVFMSMILIAGTYTWARRAFGSKTALFVAAGLAMSFWAVMTGRQALRSITLPAVFVLAVYLFWRAIETSGPGVPYWRRPATGRFALAGLLLGLTLYTYVPARVMWLLFPAMLALLFIYDRRRLRAAWPGILLALFLALLVATPLLLYLNANPGVEERLIELSGPLTAARQGDFGPLLDNAASSAGLLAFRGDSQWRYNIPGRPFLTPVMAVLFLAGLAVGLGWILKRHRTDSESGQGQATRLPRQIGFLFGLTWLILGLSPALVSGPDLSTTRAIGAQPVLYVFPAMALSAVLAWRRLPRRLTQGLVVLLFAGLFLQTARDYFIRWASAPEVRVQYESSLVETLAYLQAQEEMATAISTTTPNHFHSPAVATLQLGREDNGLRWFDGNHSLLLPQAESSRIIFSGFAPLNPYLKRYFDFAPVDDIAMNKDDVDQPLEVFVLNGRQVAASWIDSFDSTRLDPAAHQGPAQLGEALVYLGYQRLDAEQNQLVIATLWRVIRPLSQAVLFTHLLGPDGLPVAQADQLDVPGDLWFPGDVFIQLHQIDLPDGLPAGEYPLTVGLYTSDTMLRQPVIVDGRERDDHLLLSEVTIES
ncbi:MAG: glycosyltransferase family 39 protein [Chloroflexota bacterium]|jgi:4-amino-4-deoxy-L-arabinose transferase-like glycosyltransferase